MPDFVTQGIIDHDYAVLVLRRYAEATRNFWAQLIKKVKTQTYRTLDPISAFQKNEMKNYKQIRRNFDAAQTKYDNLLQKYLATSKHKEPSAIREDAFQASEARIAYIKACFDLTCNIALIERRVNAVLVETLADPWIIRSKSLVVGDPSYFQIGVDMYRMRSWSRSASHGIKGIENEMLRLRQEMEDTLIARAAPSRDLGDYLPQTAGLSHQSQADDSSSDAATPSTEKHGWVNVKMLSRSAGGNTVGSGTSSGGKQAWTRQWAFVKDGMFGWLNLSPSRTFVQESVKIGVLLCNISCEKNTNTGGGNSDDRRFCFEVRTKDHTIIIQADSLVDLKAWIVVFDAAKKQIIESNHELSGTEYAFRHIGPLLPEFASAVMGVYTGDGESGSPSMNQTPNSPRRSTDTRTSLSGGGGGMGVPSSSGSGGALSPITGAIAGITTGINTGLTSITGGTLNFQHGRSASGSGMAGYLGVSNANQLHAHMNAGKNAILASIDEISNGQFSSLGDCQAPLTPLTLINTPMPTAMTKDALLVNAFIGYSTVPSAVTANYWGTVNWAVYQRIQKAKTDPVSRDNITATSLQKVVLPQPVNPYPTYYPLHLQAQDAQMHAMFQALASDSSSSNRVTLVYRALVRPNPKQELPCKVFVTCRTLYIYSCAYGFVALGQVPLGDIVSVEGSTSTGWDTLHLLHTDGTSFSMRLYIDSGRVVRRRLQFLIDNCCSAEPLGLEKVLKKLDEIGLDKQRRFDAAIRESEPLIVGAAAGSGGGDESGKKSKTSKSQDMDDDNEDENGYGLTNKQLLQQYLTIPLSRKHRQQQSGATGSTLGARSIAPVMDRLMIEKEFELPAKTLFYTMFGDKSPVFRYVTSSLYSREVIEISPWVEVGEHQRLEREVSFQVGSISVSSTPLKTQNHDNRTYNLQRVEHKEDNSLYVVYDRRSPWELPYGSVFYVATRYIITAQSRGRCKVSVWTTVEWIRSSRIARSVAEGLIYRHLQVEATSVIEGTVKCLKKVGRQGSILNSIRLYGRVDGSNAQGSAKAAVKEVDDAIHEKTASALKPVPLPSQYILGSSASAVRTWAVDIFSSFCIFVASIGRILWRGISMNKLLVSSLLISVIFNVLLVSRSSVSFWADRAATRIVRDLDIIPSSSTIMRRSLYSQEMTDLVNDGRGLSFDPTGTCFSKFKSVVYYAPFDSPSVDMDMCDFPLATDWSDMDYESRETSKRIRQARTNLAIQRNDFVVNLRVLNRMEEELIAREWRNWVTRELNSCKVVQDFITSDSIRDYCQSCYQEWSLMNNETR